LIVYRSEKEQGRVRRELMDFLTKNRGEKWTRWICPEDEVDDYIQLRRTTSDEMFAEQKHWGRTQELILAARLYKRNFVLFQPLEQMKFIHFSAEYETVSI
jgi:hypothetical protein